MAQRRTRFAITSRKGAGDSPSARFRQTCDSLNFEKHYVVHTDYKLIMSTYYAQIDDHRTVEEASKIDFGLSLPESA